MIDIASIIAAVLCPTALVALALIGRRTYLDSRVENKKLLDALVEVAVFKETNQRILALEYTCDETKAQINSLLVRAGFSQDLHKQ